MDREKYDIYDGIVVPPRSEITATPEEMERICREAVEHIKSIVARKNESNGNN